MSLHRIRSWPHLAHFTFSAQTEFKYALCARILSTTSIQTAADGSTSSTKEGQRLAKMIAQTGICGRREAEKRIKEQRVTLNGRIVADISQRMLPTDEVWLDEHKIEWNRQYEKLRLWAVNKPREELVAESDRTKNRALLLDRLQPLVREFGEIKPINHLDYNTDGLVLYANNGRFARLLGSSETGMTRTYRVKAHGLLTESKLDGLKRGLVISGIKYSSMTAHVDKRLATNAWMTLKCTDIKARQIPTCLNALHLKANSITSTEFGPFKLGKIPLGSYTEVEVTPQLERLYYAATRKDGGMKVQRKNVSKSRGGDSANSPKIESHDAGSLTDADLDNLFIDNSDGNIKSHSMIESVKQNLTARPKKSLVSSDVDNNLGILKKLNFFLKSKQDSAKML